MLPQIEILQVCQHVKQEPDADDPNIPFKKKHQKIHRNGIVGMQEMKPHARPVRIENGSGKKVIEVHQHSRQQDEVHFFPVFPVENQGDEYRKNEVKEIVGKSFKQGKV